MELQLLADTYDCSIADASSFNVAPASPNHAFTSSAPARPPGRPAVRNLLPTTAFRSPLLHDGNGGLPRPPPLPSGTTSFYTFFTSAAAAAGAVAWQRGGSCAVGDDLPRFADARAAVNAKQSQVAARHRLLGWLGGNGMEREDRAGCCSRPR